MFSKKAVVILFFILFPAAALLAQQTFTVTGPVETNNGINITASTFYLEDLTEKKLLFSEIQHAAFKPLQQYDQQHYSDSKFSQVTTWLKFSIKNLTPANKLLLDIGKQGEIRLYDDTGQLLQKTGAYFFPYNGKQWQPTMLQVDSGQTKTFFIKLLNKVRRGPPITPMLHTEKSLQLYFATLAGKQLTSIGFMCLIAGCILVMGLFAVAQYIFRKEKLFAFYAMFCIAGSLSMIWNTNYQFSVGLPLQMRSANQVFAFAIAIFYILFIKEMIRLPVLFPKTWKLLQFILLLLMVQTGISICEYFTGLLFTYNGYYLWISTVIIASNIILFLCLLFCKIPVKHFLIAGAALLWLPNFIVYSGILSSLADMAFSNFLVSFLFGMGVFFENFFFLLALGYRNYRVEKEKNEMQQTYTRQLEQELDIKTKEIEEKQKIVEAQRIKQVEDNLKQQINDTEMAALKAQMNPHFIFNCISSIDGLIQGNDKYNATMYLNKFAKLIRNVLDSSKEMTVEFVKDIETLQLYIDLEELRSENKYSTQLHISRELLNSDCQVPPLVIQPFVENAIHHGLRNRQGNDGVLMITIDRAEEYICYSIIDNGIGRKAAGKLSTHNHQSYGIQMSTDRIKMFNEEASASVKIEDLYKDKIPAGTSVTVKLKIK